MFEYSILHYMPPDSHINGADFRFEATKEGSEWSAVAILLG